MTAQRKIRDDGTEEFEGSAGFGGFFSNLFSGGSWRAEAAASAPPQASADTSSFFMGLFGAGAGGAAGGTATGTTGTTGTTTKATLPNWVSTLSNASIKADMTAAAATGTVGYLGLETVFADVAASLTSTKTTLTASQLSDLRTIAANLNNGMTTSAYLASLANGVANTSPMNSTWTGGAATSTTLGNLAAGASATQVTELVGKWFLGTDLPSSEVSMSGTLSFSVSYSAVSKSLYGASGPSMNDVNQGYLGDCYMLASLAEVAHQNPNAISNMITDNGNGTYGVRFFLNGSAQYVTVNNQLANGGTIFNSGTYDWASLVEKAYAQLQTGGTTTGNTYSGNNWQAIGNGGAPEFALEEVTGATQITDFYANGSSWGQAVYNQSFSQVGGATGLSTSSVLSTLVSDLSKGYDLILCSMTNAKDSAGKTTLVASHAMSIYGYDSATGNLMVRNPWGTAAGQTWDTTFEVSLSTLLAAGDTITVDNVAGTPSLSAPVLSAQTANQVWKAGQAVSLALPSGTFTDPQGQALTYSATLGDGSALPAWLSFNASTRTFSGTAPATMNALTLKVTATDASGLSSFETFSASLAAAPILAAQTAAQTWTQYTKANLVLASNTFTDPNGSSLTYSATLANGGVLPSWLTFNASTLTFSGTVAAGTAGLSLKVTATDSYGLSTSETITVSTPAPSAPTVTSLTANQTWVDGSTVTLALAANTFSDPQGLALTYSAVQSNGTALPAWLTFNAATDTFTGNVPANAAGSLALKVTATDAAGLSVSETFTANFSASKAPVLTSQTANQTVVDGTVASFSLASNTFVDPQGLALAYSATQTGGAALPAWLTFNASTKTFLGYVPANSSGSFGVTVTAKDTAGLSSTESFTVSMIAPKAPVLSVQTPAQSWTVGTSVSFTLAANTFTDPQGLALTYSAYQILNPGDQLATGWICFNAATDTFSGVVPGTESGSLTLMVKATDSAGLSVNDTFTISFKKANGLPASVVSAAPAGGSSQSYGLLASA